MSIAIDEAEQVATDILDHELNGVSWQLGFERGYIAGRTASRSDKELNAAAFAMWKIDKNMERLNPAGCDFESEWSALTPPEQGEYLVRASVALSAAWEAVTE